MFSAYLLLGSNIGNRLFYLKQAQLQIENKIGKIIRLSSVYESKAWGFESRNSFLNQALKVKTNLSPEEILANIHEIEFQYGRIRDTNQYTDRTMDIDILFIDNLVINTAKLIIPHPLLYRRKFALIPVLEIEIKMEHPVSKKSLPVLLEECEDESVVMKYNPN